MPNNPAPDNPKPQPDDLRSRARQRMHSNRTEIQAMTPEEVQSLVYDLQLHQAELEIINEDLLDSQNKLSQAYNSYAELYEDAPMAYLTLDDDFIIKRANKAAAALFARTRNDLDNLNLSSLAMPEDRDRCYIYLRSANPGMTRTVEIRFIREDGGFFWGRLHAVSFKAVASERAGFRVGIIDLTREKQVEKQLRSSEERYRALAENIPDLITRFDTNLRLLYANPATLRRTGLSEENLVGRTAREYGSPPETAVIWEKAAFIALESGEPQRYELANQWQGKTQFVDIQVAPERDADGAVQSLIVIARDITERKKTEKSLAADMVAMSHLQQIGALFVKAGELTDVLGEIVDAAIVITHADMGNIQLIEPQSGCLRIVASRGFEQPFLDFWNTVAEGQGNCGTAMKNAQRSIVEDVTQSRIFVGTPALEVQLNASVRAVQSTPLISRSGALVGMLSTHWHVPHKPKQRELHFLDLLVQEAVDIIELVRAEDALRESEEKYRTLFQTMTEGFSLDELIFDGYGKPRDLRYLLVNPAFERQTGLNAKDIIGKTTLELFPDAEPVWFERYGKVVLTGEPAQFEERFGPLDRWFQVNAFPIGGNKFAVVFLDITERKLLEEDLKRQTEDLANSNKELESFSYSLSHDLRAPLRAMKGFSDILLEDYSKNLDTEGRDFLTRITGSADRMNELIDDMLNLTKISRQEMNRLEIDLSSIAATVFDDLRQAEPERNVKVVIAGRLKAKGDARLIKLALSNLLGNAWKYSGKTPDATIEFGAAEKNGERVYFVRDNGVGFDIGQAHRLFTPFQRLHTESQYPGTGIGLAIVNKVIQRHGGRIWAESGIGKGATFYFTLPFEKENPKTAL